MHRLESMLACLCALACSTRSVAPEQRAPLPADAPQGSAQIEVAALVSGRAGSEAAPEQDGPSAAPPDRRTAVVFGSSSVKAALGRVIAADLERWGFEVTRRGIVSAGLARPDFCDLREVLSSMPIGEDTAAVFVYVGMNDGQSIWLRPSERGDSGERWLAWQDARWPDVYTRRARSLFRSICQRGAERAIVMLPVAVEEGSLERKMRRIRQLQQRAARDVSCATAVSALGDPEAFARDARRLRLRDGFHLSPLGAELVWRRVQQRANLSLRPTAVRPSGPRLVPNGPHADR